MKTDTLITPDDSHNIYEYRGAFAIYDRAKRKEDLLHESFADELSKQLTPQITEALGATVTFLKRYDTAIETDPYFKHRHYLRNNILFTQLGLRLSMVSSSFWVRCTSPENSDGIIDPCADITGKKLNFEIVYDLPLKIREKEYTHSSDIIIEGISPELLEQIKHVTNQALNNIGFDNWISEIKEWLPVPPNPKERQEPKLRFEYDIIGSGWPDVLIRLYMKKAVTPEVKKQALSLLTEFLQSWNEAVEQRGEDGVIHDVFLYENVDEDEDERKMQITIFVDFGNAEPSILENLLHYINDSDLNVKKVVFS